MKLLGHTQIRSATASSTRAAIWQVSNIDYDADRMKDHLVDEFADFVAESQWGWGHQRRPQRQADLGAHSNAADM
jgi:hypothetical protein